MDRIRGVARFTVKPENVEEYKRLSELCMRRAREADPGTLNYDIYCNEDQTQWVVYEEYVNSDAGMQHMKNMGELADAIFKIVEGGGEVFGRPSDENREALEGMGVKVFSPWRSLRDET